MLEENVDGGTEGELLREEPLVRDWVVYQEEEDDKTSDASMSKGLGFHCASVWIPFSPFVYRGTRERK